MENIFKKVPYDNRYFDKFTIFFIIKVKINLQVRQHNIIFFRNLSIINRCAKELYFVHHNISCPMK
jgi:hypothetical protein